MSLWMGSHFHDSIDCNEVTFSIELLEWRCTFSDFGGHEILVRGVSNLKMISVKH